MKENIQWLIEKYTHEIEQLEKDIESGLRSINIFTRGKLQGYKEFVKDLKELLEEVQE